MIQLSYGGEFNERDLIKYIHSSSRNYIIQGQQACSLAKHTKANSLDYWLRQFASNSDTKQADNKVIDDLVQTGLFRIRNNLECPDTGERCKGLALSEDTQ